MQDLIKMAGNSVKTILKIRDVNGNTVQRKITFCSNC